MVRACDTCEKLMWPDSGSDKRAGRCWKCLRLLLAEDEVDHSALIRCPRCRATKKIDLGQFEWFGEEKRSVCCPACECDYEIGILMSPTFTSPAMLPEAERQPGPDSA